MLLTRFVVWVFTVSPMVLGAAVVSSQTTSTGSGQAYPNKPVRIMTGSTGSSVDFQARLFAPGLSSALGQPVIVENRGGAGGAIAMDTVANTQPDGYTLLLWATSLWVLPYFMHKLPFDPLKDILPITLVTREPLILIVNPSMPIKSVKELIALAKAKPGALSYASGGVGGPTHLAAALFTSMADVNLVHVAYKGGGPAVIALMGNEVQMMIATAGAAAPQIKSGRLKALAVTSAAPSVLFPGIPAAAETVPGYEAITIYGVFAPAKTPASLINRLNQELVRIVNSQDVKEKLFTSGVEAVGSSPGESAAAIKVDMAKWGKLIKEAGIREE